MPGKKAKRNVKAIIIVLVIFIMLASSTLVILVSGGINVAGRTETDATTNGNSEIYMSIDSGNASGNQMTRVLESGYEIRYDPPGSIFDFYMNRTINITVSMVNNEGMGMGYGLLAYQAMPDLNNNTFNITQLYYKPLDTMLNGDAIKLDIQVQPAFPGNDTYIGVALLNGSIDSGHIINKTDVSANVQP